MTRAQFERMDQLAVMARSEAARQLQAAQSSHSQNHVQLQQLRDFVLEYEQRLQSLASAGMPATQLQDYRVFLSRLQRALAEQERTTESSELVVESRRQVWVERVQSNENLQGYIAKLRQQERRLEEQRVQQQLDERSAFLHHGERNARD